MGIKEDLRSDVTDFLEKTVGVDPEVVSDERDLYNDLGLDSLDLLAMAQRIQVKYSVSLESESIASVRTVGDLLVFVEQRVADAACADRNEGR